MGARWVDASKGSEENLVYRIRLVALEFADEEKDGLYAAPFILCAFKYLVSECAIRDFQSIARLMRDESTVASLTSCTLTIKDK